jgi:hypothetical protein
MTTTDEPPDEEQPGQGEPLPPAMDRPAGQEGLPPDTPEEPEEEKKGLMGKIKDAVGLGDNPPDDGPPGGAEAMGGI